MNIHAILSPSAIHYPESDGKPMAESTRQLSWIVVLFGNLSALFDGRDDVFVAADLLWYPVEGQPELRIAPDVLVVFGRPPGHRGSYRQWEENGVPPTVVFEILSPSNNIPEMDDKCAFYEEHGVEEYYVYDPENNRLLAYCRKGEVFPRVRAKKHVSPRLGIQFNMSGAELVISRPDGGRFRTFHELEVAQVKQRAERAEWRAARLAELSRKARRGQANSEEQHELDRLEELPPTRPS
jgi:Uma2 family endonuclease